MFGTDSIQAAVILTAPAARGAPLSDGEAVPARATKRRSRSRSALVAAAQELLASGHPGFSLTEAAAIADVAPQTAYNHFRSRDALAAAAVDSAMTEFESYLFDRGRDVTEPLEQLSLNMRLFARMPDTHPRLAAVVVNAPDRALAGPRGYTEAALEHVSGIVAAGLANPDNLDLALMTVVASTERLMTLRALDPTRDAAEVDALAFQNLLLFGVSRARARKLVSTPLPPWPRAGSEPAERG